MSLILVPIESAYATSHQFIIVTLVLSCTVSDIHVLQFFVLLTPPLFHPNFGGVPIASHRPCWGRREQVP